MPKRFLQYKSLLHSKQGPFLYLGCEEHDACSGAHLVWSIFMDCVAALWQDLHLELPCRPRKVITGAAF